MKKYLNHVSLSLVFAFSAVATAPAMANHGKGAYPSWASHHGTYYKSGKSAGYGPVKKYRHGGWSHKYRMAPRYGAPMYQQRPAYGAAMPQPYTQSQSSQTQAAPTATVAAKPTPAPTAAKAPTIVETAVGAGAFSTLVSAVQAADLVATLNGEGPFTVFAPTDEAFSQLPEGAVSGLLSNPEALTSVLTYHVVAGRLTAADLLERGEVETLNGARLNIAQIDVATADVAASNGIIHIIDAVLTPPQQ